MLKPGSFCYSDDDREAIAAQLRKIASGTPPDEELIQSAIGEIEDRLVLPFLALDSFFSGDETPAMRRKKVARIEKAAAEILDAAADMNAAFWLNVFMGTDDLPMEKRLKIYDGDLDTLLGATPLIAATAKKMLRGSTRKTRPGPRASRNTAIANFAYGLTPYYEALTGRKPNAYSSPNATGPRGPRVGPFVRFVVTCLKPVCPEAITPHLGEIIHRQIFLPAGKAATK